ncbi:unnamed protein product [Caenorhabditis bovis]|uniref:Alpha-mannosidase n=1 Tax=Caenorhabditis bovis TaxID=2654633 RepID=A0A8S1EBH6_9PELO|nr:unnamed protein product [Caenorhabditis bovis]
MIAIKKKKHGYRTSEIRFKCRLEISRRFPFQFPAKQYRRNVEPIQEPKTDYNTFEMFKTVVGLRNMQIHSKEPKSHKKLRVFVLPFTHVDPGWLKTFESYTADTNAILTNMHNFMTKNEKMRFMWAEFVFFERWFRIQNETVRDDVRRLVSEGRLELASGSWVMTDEANVLFPVSVDNIIEGFDYIQNEFHTKPTVVWSNDPFGYSNSVPYLFRKAGVRRSVINRIHHSLKNSLQQRHAIPFRWRQYFDKNGENDVLTHVLPYTHYDVLNSCGPDSYVCCEFDFKRITKWHCGQTVAITSSNVEAKAKKLVGQFRKMSEMYEAPVLLMMLGDDFRYDMIEEWHQQHDNFLPLFDEINKGNEVKISFGTFNDYFNELESYYNQTETQPPTLSGDFFPYMCALRDYWTGYYTTRPFYKRQGRELHHLIRTADLLSALHGGYSSEVLQFARRNLSLFQHHDAITGTSKVSVMKDYSHLLHSSIIAVKEEIEKIEEIQIVGEKYPRKQFETETQRLLKIESEMTLSIFNSLMSTIDDVIAVRVDSVNIQVLGENGKIVNAQIEPFVEKGKLENNEFWLVFGASLKPLAYTNFVLRKVDNADESTTICEVSTRKQFSDKLKSQIHTVFSDQIESKYSLESDFLKTYHSEVTGLVETAVLRTENNKELSLAQNFVTYKGASGGAYLMRVSTSELYKPKSEFHYYVRGPIRQSTHLFMDMIYQRTSLKNIQGFAGRQLDIEMRVDIANQRNLEMMVRFETNSSNFFGFADSVGLQMLRRSFYKDLNVAANFYPMPSSAAVQYDDVRVTVSSNVEHGVRFYENGGIEINIDRKLNQDDGKGLGYGEDSIPVDLIPVDMRFSVLLETGLADFDSSQHSTSHSAFGHRSVQNVIYPPMVAISSNKKQFDVFSELPCDLQLLSIRPISKNRKLLTLFRHGIVQKDQDCSMNFELSLLQLLHKINAKTVQETDLSGITAISEAKNIEEYHPILPKPFDFLSLLIL